MKRYIAPLVFGIAGVAILLALGFWQLRRLEWKEGILSAIEARIAAAPVALPEAPQDGRDEYLAVTAEGVVDMPELHVLVSHKEMGPGWRIIAPFETGGRRVLLDRGFVRDGRQADDHPGGAMKVTGNLHWPDDRTSATPSNDIGNNVWFARDIGQMASALDTEPVLIVASSDTGGGILPLPVGITGIPNDHLNYAITWFSLAAVWAGMTGLFIRRINRRTGGNHNS